MASDALIKRAKTLLPKVRRLRARACDTWEKEVARARRELDLGLYTMVLVHSPWTQSHYEPRETELGRVVRELLDTRSRRYA